MSAGMAVQSVSNLTSKNIRSWLNMIQSEAGNLSGDAAVKAQSEINFLQARVNVIELSAHIDRVKAQIITEESRPLSEWWTTQYRAFMVADSYKILDWYTAQLALAQWKLTEATSAYQWEMTH